jgi:hypothetical protein
MKYTQINSTDYKGGAAVDTVINSFVSKYSALAVVNGKGWAKVPGKHIYVYNGTSSISPPK